MLFLFFVIVSANSAWAFPNATAKTKTEVQDVGAISPFLIKYARELFNPKKFLPNVTTDEEFAQVLKELLSWEGPEFYQQNFPYYLAGHTYDHRPVWVFEVGKFDFKGFVGRTREDKAVAKKYILQGVFRVLRSMEQASPDENFQPCLFILDFEGFNFAKVAQAKTVAFVIETVVDYLAYVHFAIEEALVINGNAVLEKLVNSVRPLLGSINEKIDVYGSKSRTWIEKLRKLVPPSALPEWYGGSKDFRPLAVYG